MSLFSKFFSGGSDSARGEEDAENDAGDKRSAGEGRNAAPTRKPDPAPRGPTAPSVTSFAPTQPSVQVPHASVVSSTPTIVLGMRTQSGAGTAASAHVAEARPSPPAAPVKAGPQDPPPAPAGASLPATSFATTLAMTFVGRPPPPAPSGLPASFAHSGPVQVVQSGASQAGPAHVAAAPEPAPTVPVLPQTAPDPEPVTPAVQILAPINVGPAPEPPPAPVVPVAAAPNPEAAASNPEAPEAPRVERAAAPAFSPRRLTPERTAAGRAALERTVASGLTDSAAKLKAESARPPAHEGLASKRPSVKPTKPPPPPTPAFDDLGAELDARFAALTAPAPAGAKPSSTGGFYGAGARASDYAEARMLFAQIAGQHVRPVRDFAVDLRSHDASVEWLAVCRPSLDSLARAAKPLGLDALCTALDRFSAALEAADAAAAAAGERTLVGASREALLARYDELVRAMPQAFGLEQERGRREAVILRSLLLQVKDVNKVTLDKMTAAGLTTLESLYLATPSDLAATTGMAPAIADRVVGRVQAYRAQVSTGTVKGRANERKRVRDLTERLREQNAAYQRASEAWSPRASSDKRELRKAREQTLLDLQVELARFGEVDRLARMERLPVEGKLTELEAFLKEAEDMYGAAS